MNISELFRQEDPNEPKIKNDRFIQQMGINQYTVLFLVCNHFLNIPWRVIHGIGGEHGWIAYVNSLKCRACEESFRDMEIKLNNEVNEFIKKGGKL